MSNSKGVNFFYGNAFGRMILKTIMVLHLDRVAVWFLRSKLSQPMIKGYVKHNNIDLCGTPLSSFKTYRDFFVRTRDCSAVDTVPSHLVSPCDGWLSAFEINSDSCFNIKSSHYFIKDFLQDESLAKAYEGGTCLVFRLCASDYHHYAYVDNGYQHENHFIEGILHSVQPIACEKYPVFVKNRRSWCLMDTDNFGAVVQCEIGALVVGGIVNKNENCRFIKGGEKGHFDLAGSTIVLLFEAGKIELNEEIISDLAHSEEVRVTLGKWIGIAK
ncbi:MAG: phosphatidylserine decarboxylase [Clostridia bacterium]|nr:phosphatidylserine decarboxylase [Clostridia bacterium]